MTSKKRPIILIHGLWNTGEIFKSVSKKLDVYGIEYFSPTLSHDFGKISIKDLTDTFNQIILEKYGLETEVDILGFSMGGLIGRYWINKYGGYRRTKRFISIGSPHKGTLTAQLIPSYPFRGISEMKINSFFLKDIAKDDNFLQKVECISLLTIWDLMVFPGWKAHLPYGDIISLNIFKHRNLVKSPVAVDMIVKTIVN